MAAHEGARWVQDARAPGPARGSRLQGAVRASKGGPPLHPPAVQVLGQIFRRRVPRSCGDFSHGNELPRTLALLRCGGESALLKDGAELSKCQCAERRGGAPSLSCFSFTVLFFVHA